MATSTEKQIDVQFAIQLAKKLVDLHGDLYIKDVEWSSDFSKATAQEDLDANSGLGGVTAQDLADVNYALGVIKGQIEASMAILVRFAELAKS